MLIVEVVADMKTGQIATFPCVKIEKDPAAPHCTVLYLAQPLVRQAPGQPRFQFDRMSIPSEQIRAWYEGETMPPDKNDKTDKTDPASQTPPAPPAKPPQDGEAN